MRGFLWTLINDESVMSFAATPWIPKKSYAFFTTKNRSLSLAEVLQGGSFPREGIPYFYRASTWLSPLKAFWRHLKRIDASTFFFVNLDVRFRL